MNKKRLVCFVSLFVILSAVSLMNSVSAYDGFGVDLREGSEQVIELVVDFAEPFLQVLLGGEDYTGLLLFERFLIFILLLSIVYLSLSNISAFEDMKLVTWVVAIIIPLIAVRFINYEWLNTILMSYQVLGIAILGILPFIIYMFFLHGVTESTTARKIGWIFFIVIYFGLWSTNKSDNYAQIYFWTMLAALVFLLLDGTIHRAFERQKWKDSARDAVADRIADLDKEFGKISASSLPQKIKDKRLKNIRKERDRLVKRYL